MSTYYDIHTEVFIDSQWICIDPFVYDCKTRQYKQCSTFWSGSRSYFGDAYDKLGEIGMDIEVSTCSEAVAKRNEYRLKYKDEPYMSSMYYMLAVSYDNLSSLLASKPEHTHCGYVDKTLILSHQIDDSEIWEWLSADEFKKLSPQEKEGYEFYEWNDDMHWLTQLRYVADAVNKQLQMFRSENYLWEEPTKCRLVIGIS